MSGLTFTLRHAPDQRLDLSGLTASRLAGLGTAAIAALPIGTTRAGLKVGDIFAVTGDDVADIRFVGGSERFDRIGERHAEGSILVEGDVGQRAGRLMSGGTLEIRGSTGPFAGSALSGGTLTITGDAGDDLGGPHAGEMAGLRGGTVNVLGAVGARAGNRMRRGTILVGGAAGQHAGARMIAGTLVVGGKAARGAGTLMKRGTIILAGGADATGPTFVDNGPADLLILRLMAKAFAVAPFPDALFDGSPMRRLAGDTAVSGMGEIFLPLG